MNDEITAPDKKRRPLAIALCLILVLSLIVGWSPLNKLSASAFEKPLSGKMNEVTVVMGATIAIGVAIDAIPIDSGKQVASKLFDIAGYLMAVLGAIVAMKILLAFSLLFSFGIVIPIACLFAIFRLINGNESFMTLAKKLAIFAVVLALAIPASVLTSLTIDGTFEAERTRLVDEIHQDRENIDAASDEIQNKLDSGSSSESVLNSVGGFFGNIGDSLGKITAGIRDAVTGKISEAMNIATKNLEGLMLLCVQWIVAACIVPIATLIGFGFVIKIIFGFDFNSKIGAALKR